MRRSIAPLRDIHAQLRIVTEFAPGSESNFWMGYPTIFELKQTTQIPLTFI